MLLWFKKNNVFIFRAVLGSQEYWMEVIEAPIYFLSIPHNLLLYGNPALKWCAPYSQ